MHWRCAALPGLVSDREALPRADALGYHLPRLRCSFGKRLPLTHMSTKRRTRAAQPDATPVSLGYRMPAEWEPHAATWLAWPHERTDWPGKFAPIPWVYADIVRHLSQVERVRILIEDAAMERAARRNLKSAGANLTAV